MYLIRYKKLTRFKLKELAREWRVEPDTLTRRARELCNEFPIKRYDQDDNEVVQSEHICYWKLVKEIKRNEVWKA